MTARRTAVNAEFVLHTQHAGLVEIEEIRRPPIGIQIFLEQLEAHPRRVFVALHPIVHRSGETV